MVLEEVMALGLSQLLLNFSAIVAFLVDMSSIAGQEGVFLHKIMLAL